MGFSVIAADSLGVRSLAVLVADAFDGALLIDPGAALGPRRYGLPPHKEEELALHAASQRIAKAADAAGRIAITHFHHDHFAPFEEEKWIVSGTATAELVYREKTVYLRDLSGPVNPRQRSRGKSLVKELTQRGVRVEPMDGRSVGDVRFSSPFRHGDERSPGGWVVAVAVETSTGRLVHMSDTQLLNDDALDWTLRQKPSVVVTSGPPLYLPQLTPTQIVRSKQNLMRLVEQVPRVIVDHHLRRGGDIDGFLSEAVQEASRIGHRLDSAASCQGRADELLEARRRELYDR
jgi:predicted metallo-beta-lactamase superfamily hydrolase